MIEKRKKGNGYEEVKLYVLDRLRHRLHPGDPFVRIVGEEIARAVGITPQSANEHVRALVRHGVFHRERRCYFSECRVPPPPGVSPVASNAQVLSVAMPGTESETTWTFPIGNLRRMFTDADGNVHLVFSGAARPPTEGSENLPGTFTEPDDRVPESSETFSESSQTKKDYKEERKKEKDKEKKEREKNVDDLGKWVDTHDEGYRRTYQRAVLLFDQYGAGTEQGTSPKLINRFAAGYTLNVPLVTFEELEEQLKLAVREYADYESFRGYGRRSGIRKPFVRIACYLKKCFVADGWTWTKFQSSFDQRLKDAHQDVQATFPQFASGTPPVSVAKTDGVERLETPPHLPPPLPSVPPQENRTANVKRIIPHWLEKLIDRAGFGKPPLPDKDR